MPNSDNTKPLEQPIYQPLQNLKRILKTTSERFNGLKIEAREALYGRDTEKYKDGFIAYSLGNFVFDQKFSKDTMQGLVLKIKIKGKEIEKITKNLVSLNSFFQPDKVVEIK